MILSFFKNKYFWGVLLIILIVFIINFSGSKIEEKNRTGQIVVEQGSEWQTYVSKDYNFSISFPKTWKVYENIKEGVPAINIYKPRFGKKPPFDHFSETDQISIFPEGAPAEGIVGEEKYPDFEMNQKTKFFTNFILTDGRPWATFMTFESVPKSWKSWGFIWIEAKVDGVEYGCVRGNENISVNECNPYGGDVLTKAGKLDDKIRKEEIEIIKTFKFIE